MDTKQEPEGCKSWRPGNDITSKCDHERRQGVPYRRNHHELEAKEEDGRRRKRKGHRSEKKEKGRKGREEKKDADKHF